MSDALFSPAREDGRSEWRVVYDLFVKLEPGQALTHAELLDELQTDNRMRLYSAVRRANKELWAADHRSVANIKGVGYRMLQPLEHERQAMTYKRRSRRQIGNAVKVAGATDLLALTPSEKVRAIEVHRALSFLAEAMDKTMRRVDDHETRLRALEGRAEPKVIDAESA